MALAASAFLQQQRPARSEQASAPMLPQGIASPISFKENCGSSANHCSQRKGGCYSGLPSSLYRPCPCHRQDSGATLSSLASRVAPKFASSSKIRFSAAISVSRNLNTLSPGVSTARTPLKPCEAASKKNSGRALVRAILVHSSRNFRDWASSNHPNTSTRRKPESEDACVARCSTFGGPCSTPIAS